MFGLLVYRKVLQYKTIKLQILLCVLVLSIESGNQTDVID